jgi:hypothetical protein
MLEISSVMLMWLAAVPPAGAYPHQCGAALPGWEAPLSNLRRVENRLRLKASGSLEWNGSRVSEENVVQYLQLVTTLPPQPFTILEIEKGASCERATAVRMLIDRWVKCRAAPVCGETEIAPSK